jgi:eukaryotic-like serine/threonine-protein kinase
MTDPETRACARLTDLLDQTLQDLRAGRAIGSSAREGCHPEEAARLRALLQTAQTLDAAAEDWRGAARAAATGPAAADPTEPLPAQVGRYQVLGRVGSGGMGAVYRARDPELDRVVAVKVPRFQGPAEARELARQRFLREARAAARVRHPNICPLYDVGEHEGAPYAVMAFIDGPSLAEALRQGPMEPARAVRLARKVALALEAVHAEGVIHRDLKPANVLLDRAGEPLLTDFGLARSLAPGEPLTEQGAVMGTPAYMAPEQAAGDLGRVGPWTDVYGLGVVLSRMLAGRGSAARPAQRTATPAGHETLLFPDRADLDPALAEVLDRATARRPEDRYQSAGEMADALDRWLAGGAPATAVPGMPRAVPAGTPAQTAVESVLPDGSAVTVTVNHPAAAKDVTVTVSEQKLTRRRRRKVIRITVAFGVPVLALLPLAAWWLAESSSQAFRGGSWLPWQRARDERRAAEQAAARVEAAVAQADGLKRAGKPAEAIAAYEKAEPLVAQVYGSESPQTAALAADVAALYQAQGQYAKAETLYQRSLKIRVVKLGPDHPEVLQTRTGLATLYQARGEYARAEAEYRQVRERQERLVRENPEVPEYQSRLAQTESNLGKLYRAAGRWDQALTSYRRAIALKPDDAEAYNNLGNALLDQKKPGEAEAAYRRAIALRPHFPEAYIHLGAALRDQKRLGEAVAAFRKAIELRADFPEAYIHLGNALRDRKQLAEAVAAYRQAIDLDPKSAAPHNGLGNILRARGKQAEAAAEYRRAIELDPKDVAPHINLGNVLRDQGRPEEAAVEFREAIQLKPDYPEAHCNLGHVLQRRGQFAAAVTSLKRGHELGSRNPRWPYPSARWVREAERLLELDQRLSAVLKGEGRPADGREQVALAQLCRQYKRLYAASARFYAAAFTADPKLTDDRRSAHRYNAACAAALAAAGKGEGAAKLDAQERARLRGQALTWLRADLDAWTERVENSTPPERAEAAKLLRHWQADPDFAGVRGPAALGKLPEKERAAWARLWADVQALLEKADGKGTDGK